MTDREKLIELLGSTESAFYWNSDDKSFVEKIADHLIANGVVISKNETTTQRWIPVTERLPDENKCMALVYVESDGIYMAEFARYECGCRGFLIRGKRYPKITHWMPMPEPPKEE